MPPVVTSAEIGRPAAEVFAYATDPARFSEWQKGVVDGHMDGPGNGTQAPAVRRGSRGAHHACWRHGAVHLGRLP